MTQQQTLLGAWQSTLSVKSKRRPQVTPNTSKKVNNRKRCDCLQSTPPAVETDVIVLDDVGPSTPKTPKIQPSKTPRIRPSKTRVIQPSKSPRIQPSKTQRNQPSKSPRIQARLSVSDCNSGSKTQTAATDSSIIERNDSPAAHSDSRSCGSPVIERLSTLDQPSTSYAVFSRSEDSLPRSNRVENTGGGMASNCDFDYEQDRVSPFLDTGAAATWIFPRNFDHRDYQHAICESALAENTLVSLPTGLGKTFIAAVVMYNFHRWFPTCKVVFVAPTKPLVVQQRNACFKATALPAEETCELVGSVTPQARRKLWHTRRVFFLTPQTLANDISSGLCPAHLIRLLVLDEAHRATGDHAYCQVIHSLLGKGSEFRVVALTATPGNDIMQIQQIITNLMISRIEFRTDDSPDVAPYLHQRDIERLVIPHELDSDGVQEVYVKIMSDLTDRLVQYDLLRPTIDVRRLKKGTFFRLQQDLKSDAGAAQGLSPKQIGIVRGIIALCMSVFHGFELLNSYGSKALYDYLKGTSEGDRSSGRFRQEIRRNRNFQLLISMLDARFGAGAARSDLDPGSNPKLNKLLEVVCALLFLSDVVVEVFFIGDFSCLRS